MSEQISYFDIAERRIVIILEKKIEAEHASFEVSVLIPQRDGDERDESYAHLGMSFDEAVEDYRDCIRIHLEAHMP